MAMVAAALRREGKRVINVRSSILYDKCMHFSRINDQSDTNQLNLNSQRTTLSTGSLRAHHTFISNAYRKPAAGYLKSFAVKFTTQHGEEEANTTMEEEAKGKQGDDESSNVRIGGMVVHLTLDRWASHSLVNAQTAEALLFETKPTPPTTVTYDGESYTCDRECVIKWRINNMHFTWTFLVTPLPDKLGMVLGFDWMKHVSPLILDLGDGPVKFDMPHGMYVLKEIKGSL